MIRQTLLTLSSLILLLPFYSQAQDKQSSSTTDAAPVNVPKDVLASNGLSFADQGRPMCKIGGPDGPCRVEAFVHGETREDEAKFTCSKLDHATYVGHCVKGKVNGLSLVIADGSKKLAKEAYISYFDEGRIAYPALNSFLVGDSNFGAMEKGVSYGCVYFGKWDKSSERCALFIKIYGQELFTESNAQKLRNGTFDLDNYRTKFLEFMRQKH